MDTFLSALPLVADPSVLLAILVGAFIGLVFGSVPGLTYSLALAVVLPMTFKLGTTAAVGMLLGTYIGGMTGGSVAAILIGIPGTPSAAATVLDGYPMAKAGKAGLALGTAVLVSVFGGLLSLAVMIVSVDFVARMAIKFGPVEIFALVLFGLSTICGLAEKSLLRGLIAGTLGLLVMTVGLDPIDGVQRMTFGSVAFLQGVDLLVAMVGLFAVPQIMQTLIDWRRGQEIRLDAGGVRSEMPSLRELRENWWVILRSSLIGTGIGSIPGTGGPIAAFLAYDQARRFSKNGKNFGKGELAGVIAPEAANNSVTGGAMIPLLSLGIPGDPATAIILGGLLIHGLTPGPLLFMEHQVEVYTIYLTIVVAYLGILVFQYFGIKLFVRVLRVPPHILAVLIAVLCAIGTFAIRNSFFDIYVMTTIGLLGYLLLRARIPVTPIILGLVLGPTLESNLRTALVLSEGNPIVFFQSTPAMIFFGLTLLVIAFHFIGQTRARRAAPNAEASIDAG